MWMRWCFSFWPPIDQSLQRGKVLWPARPSCERHATLALATSSAFCCTVIMGLVYCNYGFSLRILMRLSIWCLSLRPHPGPAESQTFFCIIEASVKLWWAKTEGHRYLVLWTRCLNTPNNVGNVAGNVSAFSFTLGGGTEAIWYHLGRALCDLSLSSILLFFVFMVVLSQEMLFLFAAFVAWLMTVSAFASIYTQQPGHALDVVLIPRAWNSDSDLARHFEVISNIVRTVAKQLGSKVRPPSFFEMCSVYFNIGA